MKFRTSGTGGEGFDCYTFVNECKELSFYDTGITPRYGDKLVTLPICDYAMKNGRMVVMGRRI